MTTADPAALDQFIRAFTGQVGGGFGAIASDVQTVLAILVVISITLTAVLWAIDETQNVLAPLVRKILLIGFFSWLVTNWHSLSLTVVNGFAKLGLQASGGGSIGDFTKAPTRAVEAGLSVVVDLIKYIGDLAQQNGGFGALVHIDMIIVAGVAAIGILLAFIILAIEIAVTIIEFYIVTLIAFVVVPFGVLSQTSFLAERAIGYVISVGFKFMALAVIAGIGINIFETYTLSAQPTVAEEAGLLLSAIFLMMLSLKVPSIAGALISGGPQLNSGSALMGAAGVAAGAAGGALAGRAVAGAMGSLAGGGGQVAAARAASGAINSGGSSGGGSSGGGGSPSGSGPAPGSPRSPASSDASASRAAGGGVSPDGAPPPEPSPSKPSPTSSPGGASLVARAEARRGDGLTSMARNTA
ncbi:MAG: P-type conjugative transfer protein TrbL, partial [Caulobacter vibrioides]